MTSYQRLVQWYRRWRGLPTIWPFRGSHDCVESAIIAMESKIITHVAIWAGNRETSDTLGKQSTQAVIGNAHRRGIPVILMRGLFRTQPPMPRADLWDFDWWDRQVNALASDAARVSAEYVGFDIESYGPTDVHDYFRQKSWEPDELHAIADCIGCVGKVDYITPAGAFRRNHPYRVISQLGRNRICQATYYDRTDTVEPIDWPYEITGRFLNVTKDNPTRPYMQFWLASEVLADWRHPLMLWQESDVAVAEALREFME